MITGCGNVREDGTKQEQGDHSAWQERSEEVYELRLQQPGRTHVRVIFQSSHRLQNRRYQP